MNIIRIPDAVRIITDDTSAVCEKNGSAFTLGDVRVSFSVGETLDITVNADTTPVKFIGIRFNGSFDKGTRFLGDSLERGYAEYAFRGFESERQMYWYFLAASENKCAGYGVKTGESCNSLVSWTTDIGGIMLWLDVRNGGMGVIRNSVPFEACRVVNVEKNVGMDKAFDFLHDFCLEMCDNAIFPDRPVYGSNNWYYAYGDSSAKQIIRDTELLAECTKGLENRPFMVIDDCWQQLARTKGSAQGRPIFCGNEMFPDMKGLADEIKAHDIHPGIWFRPLKTAERFIDRNLLNLRDDTFLDPSLPEVLDLIAEDTERLTGTWGYELIKYDFVTRDTLGAYGFNPYDIAFMKPWHFHDRSKTSAMVTKDLYRTIYEHSNGAVIIGCNVIGHLATGYIHLHRSGDDTSGRSLDRSVAFGINTLAFRMVQHKAFFDIDADCVCITDMLPWENNKDLLEIYSLSGTPLFVSVDPDIANDRIKAALTKAYSYSSKQLNKLVPIDWIENNLPAEYLIDGEPRRYNWVPDTGKLFIYSK